MNTLTVRLPRGGFNPTAANGAVSESGLPELMQRIAPGPFGQTATGAAVLEALAGAIDLGLCARGHLEGAILKELSVPDSFSVTRLETEHERLLAAFQIVVTADAAVRRIGERCPVPDVDGALELDGVDGLLNEVDGGRLAARMVRLARAFLEMKARGFQGSSDNRADQFAGTTLGAAFELLRRAITIFSRTGSLSPMVAALARRRVTVAGFGYHGFELQSPSDTPSGLLPVRPEDIVGNDDYVAAGLRLARDVAGYDFERGQNPKKLNPVLFGLGSPGCGKTITAHAIGNYFLDFCRQREIPGRFVVVRRTDWASSYQNASANNLVRIFKEEVYGFDGVCGVYWPDIDTAFASRASGSLRMEEKNNLGAVFGVFDGTLLPKDGKWFLICDANTMRMDEATVSRIAQNPFNVSGPASVEDYVRMMWDIMLRDVREFVPAGDDSAWREIGELAVKNRLSGRAIDTICNNIRTRIQDFEYPDNYFCVSSDERQRMLGDLSNAVDGSFIKQRMNDWVSFQAEAQKREEQERFDHEVDTVVRQLNASRKAMEKAAAMGLGE